MYVGTHLITGAHHDGHDGKALFFRGSRIWAKTCSITQTLDGVTSDAPSSVAWGDGLVVTLAADSDTQMSSSSVVVMMGGVDITSTAYDSATNTITIASVTGNVAITAAAAIIFADAAVKAICAANWGGTIAGEITKNEAAAVTSLGGKFKGNTTITKFNELKFFKGLTSMYISGNSTASQGEFYNCTNLTQVTLPAASISNMSGAFRNIKIGVLDLSPLLQTGNMNGTCHNNTSMTKVILPGITFSGDSWAYTFRTCSNLTTIEIDGTADFSNVTTFNVPFYACTDLETITGTVTGIKANISFASSPKLTRESLLVIINGLAQVTTQKTLTLHATAKARLTADDLAIATAKNWIVS